MWQRAPTEVLLKRDASRVLKLPALRLMQRALKLVFDARAGEVVEAVSRKTGTMRGYDGVRAQIGRADVGIIVEARRGTGVEALGVEGDGARGKAVVEARTGEVVDAVGCKTGTVRGDVGVGSQGGRADVAAHSATPAVDAGGDTAGSARGSGRSVETSGVAVAEPSRVAVVEVRGEAVGEVCGGGLGTDGGIAACT